VRIIGYNADYVPYDRMIRITLPTLWGPPAREWEDRIDSRLESTLRASLGEKDDVLEVLLSGRIAEGAETPTEPRPWKETGSDNPFEGYAVSGENGLRILRDLDLLTREIRIRCATSACDAVRAIDLSPLIAPFRDMSLLQKTYEAAPPAESGRKATLYLDRIQREDVDIGEPTDIRYPIAWIDTP